MNNDKELQWQFRICIDDITVRVVENSLFLNKNS